MKRLRAIIGSNSKNSSKPPFTDSLFCKPNLTSLRTKTGGKNRCQAGHKNNRSEANF